MKTSLIIRFVVAAVLVSTGCALLLAGVYRIGILFGLATVVCMPRSEFTQPISHRELWIMLGVLFGMITAIVAANRFFPPSAADAVLRVMRHPAFVVSVWLFMMWALFRYYRRQKSGVDA